MSTKKGSKSKEKPMATKSSEMKSKSVKGFVRGLFKSKKSQSLEKRKVAAVC